MPPNPPASAGSRFSLQRRLIVALHEVDAGVVPMSLKPPYGELVLSGVAERARLQRDSRGDLRLPFHDHIAYSRLHFGERLRLILVADAGPDDVRELEPLLREFLFHDVGRAFLGVVGSAIGDERHVEQVATIVGHVVEPPQGLHILGRHFIGRDLLVSLHVDEPGPRVHGAPLISVVRAEVPRSCAPIEKPATLCAIIAETPSPLFYFRGIVSGSISQISRQYSRIARSEENLPI
jgi:hypothetical protein